MTANATAGGGAFERLVSVSRAGEWWEYKLVPVFAVFYATCLETGVPLWSMWPAAVALLAALLPGAAYVSVLNDATDIRVDRAAGKPNRIAGKPRALVALMLALPAAAGLAVAWLWRDDPPLLLAYLGAWLAYTLYSLPPLRLKTRGLAGVLADAAGAHLFPTLVAVLLVFRQAGAEVDAAWTVAVALWAAAYGVRGILWHQLSDFEADRAAGVATFALRRGPGRVAALARFAVFPLELAALAVLLALLAQPAPVALLLVYALLARRKTLWWEMKPVVVQPRPRYFILLLDYYDAFLPAALLATAALVHPLDALLLIVHMLLFPKRLRTVTAEAWRLRTHAAAHVPVS